MSDVSVPDPLPVSEQGSVGATSSPSWLDQDAVLREMWLANQPPQAISEALSRSIPAVMTRAARLGLPRRAAPGRKPGVRRTEGHNETNRLLSRGTSGAAAYQSTHVMPQTSLRVCLMCLNKFESLGRHNRICSSCKGSSEYESASSLPELHIPAT